MRASLAVPIVALLLLPFAIGGYYLYLVDIIFIDIILALGLNILMGEAGLFGLAHVAFYGIGVYVTGSLTNAIGLSLPLGALSGGLVAAAVGYLIGVVSVRLRDIYLALSTFAFAQAALWVSANWTSVTRGPNGLRLAPANVFGLSLIADRNAYYFVMASGLFFIWLTMAIGDSGFGRAMRAIRESEPAAAAVGINVARTKALAFAASAFYAGCAGGVFTAIISFVHPDLFSFDLTIVILSTLVVGGIGTIGGPILGAVVLGVLSEALRRTTAYQEVLHGLILVLFMVFAPGGLVGLIARVREPRHG